MTHLWNQPEKVVVCNMPYKKIKYDIILLKYIYNKFVVVIFKKTISNWI